MNSEDFFELFSISEFSLNILAKIWLGNGKFKIITNKKLRMGKNVRKIVDANRDEKDEEKRKELQLDDKGISSLTDIDNNLSTLSHLTRLILAHNRLTKITQGNSHDS